MCLWSAPAPHLEHFTRSFAVTGAEDGCVHVMEARALEERVRRVGQRAAHPRHCADCVGPWPKVCNAAQELQRVPFLCSHYGIKLSN